ncbi:hypothetical protein E2C01_067141 [Portunus trituberculatus]|uniref:Uncharacterized protein n=1 Tax=Portunus trituberculatus TaxID=210409 RepID=A0A5B7HU85_PORTR|nr:hypothetical protein [Portunus trituberculatus]
MGACAAKKQAINPGSALDLVISQASSDDCVLYRLADYKKGKGVASMLSSLIPVLSISLMQESRTIMSTSLMQGKVYGKSSILILSTVLMQESRHMASISSLFCPLP